MPLPFQDRRDAGRELAARLEAYRGRVDVVVLGLPRGGVPVAFEVAAELAAPLDVFLVRKLGVPGHEELAMGAIASGGTRVLNEDVIRDWQIPDIAVDAVTSLERQELARRDRLYRGTQAAPAIGGKTAILVDDGLATGSTMRAAAEALRKLDPARIVVAVPVAALPVCDAFADVADETVCAETPEPFHAVGLWYEDFSPTSDDEVRMLLRQAEEQATVRSPAEEQTPDAASLSLNDSVRAPATQADDPAAPDRLLDLVGDAPIVRNGEATHGTQSTRRLRSSR
ncbi:MAG: phosphoribosyltransferase family protein [Thermomicrobiales bacterium]